ncbi:hypothetical protein E4U57_000383 [Claviceps arundinis]|uniref:Uncharacterized protein n=1 Tax=Claviceps arundinis TaxID=1623583 RepID=A0ABQ7PD36_9HYPO|nr:hypothetical protein E4U57_000383 [Claviceps arundinis]
MGLSVIQEQHDIILNEIRDITQGDWKCLIVDENSRKIVDNVVTEDEVLNINIASQSSTMLLTPFPKAGSQS